MLHPFPREDKRINVGARAVRLGGAGTKRRAGRLSAPAVGHGIGHRDARSGPATSGIARPCGVRARHDPRAKPPSST